MPLFYIRKIFLYDEKTASFLCLMLMTIAVQVAPSDSERIASLERQVAELTAQVNFLLSERLDERSARRNRTQKQRSSCVRVVGIYRHVPC